MPSVNRAVKREGETPTATSQMDTLMRRFLDQSRGEASDSTSTEIVATSQQEVHPKRDFDMASELLDRAAAAFDLLISRYQRLERDLDEANERARAQSVEHEEIIEQWKRLASGLKIQLDAADQAASALKTRCETVEAHAAMAEQRASGLERSSALAASQAARAEQLSTKLHDKVVSTFGIGSRAHPVLEAIATQAMGG